MKKSKLSLLLLASFVWLQSFAAITISPTSISGLTVGVYFEQAITPAGGSLPYIVYLSSGTLPTGVSLTYDNYQASLTGTPSSAASYTFSLGARDATGATGTQSYTVTVTSAGLAIVAVTPPLTLSTNTLAITQAATGANGYLSSTDWNTFNNKVSSQWQTGTGSYSTAVTYTLGNVGIGTYTPTARLQVVGSGSTTVAKSIDIYNSSNVELFAVYGSSQIYAGDADKSLYLGINNGLNKTVSAVSNTATGVESLVSCTDCAYNTTNGSRAARSLTTGQENVIGGRDAAYSLTTGSGNVLFGNNVFSNATDASSNSIVGYKGFLNTNNPSGTTGETGLGYRVFFSNTTGERNIGIGVDAGYANTTGSYIIAIGSNANVSGTTGDSSVVIGTSAATTNTTGRTLTIYGSSADVGSNNLSNAAAIGYKANVASSNTMSFGNHNVSQFQFNGALMPWYSSAYNAGTSGQILTSQGAGVAPQWKNGSTTFVNDSSITAGDAATINAQNGFFIKDATGTTYTLTNSYITSKSRIFLQFENGYTVTGNAASVTDVYAGGAVITFYTLGVGAAAPTANQQVSFLVTN